jgi:hypothetical protein
MNRFVSEVYDETLAASKELGRTLDTTFSYRSPVCAPSEVAQATFLRPSVTFQGGTVSRDTRRTGTPALAATSALARLCVSRRRRKARL